VIDADVIPPLVEILFNADFEVKRTAAWAVCNISCGGTKENIRYGFSLIKGCRMNYMKEFYDKFGVNIRYLADQGCIKALCELLTSPEAKLVLGCLQALENILKVGKADQEEGLTQANVFVERVLECQGVHQKISCLLANRNQEITATAWRLSDTIWPGNNNDQDSD